MATTWIPPLPERFGQLKRNYALMVRCASGGCHRGTRFDRDECVRRWGEEGNIADVLKRFKCRRCGRRRVSVEIVRDNAVRTVGERVRDAMTPVDRLARAIADVRPEGKVE